MKNLIILSILIINSSFQISGQKNIDQIFRKYKNDEGVVNMNFTGEVLKMINSSENKIKSSVDIVDILIFPKNQDISKNDESKITNLLSRDKFDLLIDIKNKEQKVKLYALDSGRFLEKIYAHVNSPDMNAYFILSGKIIFDELAKLGMDFQNGDAMKLLSGNKSDDNIRP